MVATTTYTYATGTAAYLNPHAVATTTAGSSLAYTYDNNGNLTGNGTWEYNWDYNNRMANASTSGTSIAYTYDLWGQRVTQNTGATTTIYSSKFYNTDGTTPTKNIFLPDGTLIATVVGTGTTTSVSYIHIDHLGGTNVATNESGEVVQLLDYYPYGSQRLDEQSGFNTQRQFTGHEFDAGTRLVYANARYYGGSNGQFISQDPQFISAGFDLSNPQSFNSYSYAGNNPIVYVDPTGMVYFSAKSLGQNLGGFGVGLLQGGWSFVKGAYNTVSHPVGSFQSGVQTLDNVSALIANEIMDPAATNQAIAQAFSNAYDGFDSKSAYEQGNTIGNITGKIEAGILAGAGFKKVVNGIKGGISSYAESVSSETNWGDPSTLLGHTVRHGWGVGTYSPRTYAQNASNLFQSSMQNNSGILMKTDAQGVIRIYDQSSNIFAAYNANGTTRTIFNPQTGPAYWLSQPGK